VKRHILRLFAAVCQPAGAVPHHVDPQAAERRLAQLVGNADALHGSGNPSGAAQPIARRSLSHPAAATCACNSATWVMARIRFTSSHRDRYGALKRWPQARRRLKGQRPSAAEGGAIAEEDAAPAHRFVPEAMCGGGSGTLIAQQCCRTITGPENGHPCQDAQPCRNRSFVERLAHAEASREHGQTRCSPNYNSAADYGRACVNS